MTDQSRVEAVANAVGNVTKRQGGFVITDPGDALTIAQAAIEANDAWLKENVDGVAREIRKAEARSMGLNYTDDDWIHDRNRMSERWHITMGKAQSAINATISQKETDR